MLMAKNNFPISFESHIIDDVMDKTGGVYDRNQIRDVFRASISYVNNLCTYTDNVSVSFPYVGDMVCNLHEMERRKHNLERLKSKVEKLSKYQEKELQCLDIKIRMIKDAYNSGEIKGGDMLIKHNKLSIFKSRKGHSFSEIQNIQEQEFNR